MEKALDLRIQKTYLALISSFKELLEKKHFEKITVQEICDLALIRRATFYKHFADKYELFAFMVKDIINSFNSKRREDEDNDLLVFYTKIIENTFDFLDENQKLVHSVMGSDVLNILLNILSEQIVIDLKESFHRDKKNGKQLLASPELMAQAFTGALISIAKWWIVSKKPIAKEEVVECGMTILHRLVNEM